MKPLEMAPKMMDDPRHHYQATIESPTKISELAERAVDAKITISTRELLSATPDVRKHVKELVTGHRTAINVFEEDEEEELDSYLTLCMPPTATFSIEMDKYKSRPHAAISLPLRVLYPTFVKGIKPECILDSGAQVCVMCRDIWEKLHFPINPDKAMNMESTNATRSLTMGLVKNLPMCLGPMKVYLQMQVVNDTPFEVLLGRPFFNVTSCSNISSSGGDHEIRVRDPKTGYNYLFPTQP